MSTSTPRKNSSDSLPSPLFSPQSPGRNNEYPFPRYEIPQRPGSSSRFQPRRGSTASSINSIGGTLDTSTSNWTHSVQEAGQNAISTLLQPPIVRTGLQPHLSQPISSAHKPPTARDIPPVALSNIVHIDNSDFRPYITQVGTLYDALQRARDAEEDLAPWLSKKNSRYDDFSDLLELEGGKTTRRGISRQASLASLASLSPVESPKPKRRTSGQGRRAPQGPTPLNTIPAVYFDDDFHLENPRTFDVVSERSEVVRPTPGSPDEMRPSNGNAVAPRKALATNAILQEKLSWYMDTIEVHLISSISTASSSFFAALGSLRELHSEASESVGRIQDLREELNALDKEMALGGLEIISKRRKRENLKHLSDAVQQLKCIVAAVMRCEALVEGDSIDLALDAIDSLENLISGENSENDAVILDIERQTNLRNLGGATALQGVTSDIDILRSKIGKSYESQFLGALLGDLRHHISSVQVQDILQRWSSASQRSRGHNREPSAFPAYLTLNDDFRRELLGFLKGLHRANYTASATSAYRDCVLKEVKTIIKKPLPSSNDDDNDSMVSVSTVGGRQLSSQDRSHILARNLRALEPASAEEMLLNIYMGVGETLRRLGTQVKVLLDVTSTLGQPIGGGRTMSPPRNSGFAGIDAHVNGTSIEARASAQKIQEEIHQALDMSNLLGQAVDIAQNQIVKVLRVRTEQSISQTPTRFLRYFTLNLLFANECEAVSGRSGTALKTVVNGHIESYIKRMGETQQQELAAGMDADQWNAKDFGDKDSVILSRLLEGSDRDPEAWTAGGRVWLPYDEPTTTVTTNIPPTTTSTKDKTRPATIESDIFILPNSAILCLHGLEPFLELITGIPSLTSDIAASLLSYLQLFNSRCTQLILGAGATRSVGLKNITTKHLALASQALSFISTLIPHIREFVRRHMGSGPAVGTLMGEFDKVRRLYQEHQNNISDKLVDIMAGRAATHVKAMKTIRWDDKKVSSGVNPYMDTLVKETSTLHKVLSRHLPDMTVAMVMDPVFKSYKDQWGKAFGDVVLDTDGGKERMLQDVEYFNNKLSKINGSADIGTYLTDLVRKKAVLKPSKPEPQTAPAVEQDLKTEIKADQLTKEDAPLPPLPANMNEENVEANGIAEVAKNVEIPTTPAIEKGGEDVQARISESS